ncbi:diphosphomevalonate decarboxylase [Rhodanobacter lindaniclasticus]|uniref:diphosphomevalonate decarboxylase n=1 Tax=Rhodanobacter lindaniclasticus TaxID=75310 RepID=A0A4V3US30_9GAMM|nr:diphosphomevalonate decarboxylase [Rhodanobacter lindaniclasticus]THD05131.1 diphosphomevalonate decarboxylase [Rhodanobacter lindaniclasticus]
MDATAQAQPNIALVKYWGKRDTRLNLPVTGSLSITLDALWTRTRVEFDALLRHDELRLNGAEDPATLARASACLDLLRRRAGTALRARIDTRNNFPTAAGLASSASGFAALVVAADAALGLGLDRRTLSMLARQGSGSAARSLFGGFVGMAAGQRDDGADAVAQPLLDAAAWPLAVVVAVTSDRRKHVGSGAGMERSRRTSPFYPAWLDSAAADLAAAQRAVQARDFAALAELSEHNCLKMHAVMQSSRPPLLYWNGATVDCMQRIRALREDAGEQVFFTVDAGAQVKAVCTPDAAPRVAAALAELSGVEQVLSSRLGEGARLLDDSEAP